MSDAERTIRGCVLVICNSFVNRKADRTRACEADGTTMKELWGNMLRCNSFPINEDTNADFIVHYDVDAKAMLKLLEDFACYRSRTDYSYVAVVISSHGGVVAESWAKKWDPTSDKPNLTASWKTVYDDYVNYGHDLRSGLYDAEKMVEVFFANDLRPIREEKIRELFHNDAAKGWHDVPKFFILSYCRGNAIDCGVIRIPGPLGAESIPIGSREDDRRVEADFIDASISLIPKISDVLVVYATHRSYEAYRGGEEYGSWLVSTIGKIFTKYARKMHVVDMLTLVNGKMKRKEGKLYGVNRKAMSVYESSLEQNLYLCDEAKTYCDDLNRELIQTMKLEAARGIGESPAQFFERAIEIPAGEAQRRELVGRDRNIRHRREASSREQRLQQLDEPRRRENDGELRGRTRDDDDLFDSEEVGRMEPPRPVDRWRYERRQQEHARENDDPRYWDRVAGVREGRMQHYGEILLVFCLVAVFHLILWLIPSFHK